MFETNVYQLIRKKGKGDQFESIHAVVLIPEGGKCYKIHREEPTNLEDIISTRILIDQADHYYNLLITVSTKDDSVIRWSIEHVRAKEYTLISVGTSKKLLKQEVERLTKEGYSGYGDPSTSQLFAHILMSELHIVSERETGQN